MTHSPCRIVVVAAIVLCGGPHLASAQDQFPVQFTTSFPFAAGVTTVPAGTYTMRADDDDLGLCEIGDPLLQAMFQVNNHQESRPAAKSEAVFERIGDEYVLTRVLFAGSDQSITLVTPASHAHRHEGLIASEVRVPIAKVSRTGKPRRRHASSRGAGRSIASKDVLALQVDVRFVAVA